MTAAYRNDPEPLTSTREDGHCGPAARLPDAPTPGVVSPSEALRSRRDLIGARIDWRQEAACRGHDPDLWFSALPADRGQAAAVCTSCPVQARCLSAALGFEATGGGNYGLWGGHSERDRRQALAPTRASAKRGPSRWGHTR